MPVIPVQQQPEFFSFVETLAEVGFRNECGGCSNQVCKLEKVTLLNPELTIGIDDSVNINAAVVLRCEDTKCNPADDVEMVQRVLFSAVGFARVVLGENKN